MSWAIWITGPPASGKSAIARAVTARLQARGRSVKWLELDEVRACITPDARYTDAERDRVYRALGYLATKLVEAGRPVIIDATAHRRLWRDSMRAAVPLFAEVQLVCPTELCRERERTRTGHAPPNIYARAGQPGATVPGIDVPYEGARAPELLIDTAAHSLDACVERVVRLAESLAARVRVTDAPVDDAREPAWIIWITGCAGTGGRGLAQSVLGALRDRGRHVQWLDLEDAQRHVVGGEATSEEDLALVDRTVGYASKVLAEAGEAVIVDARTVRCDALRRSGSPLIADVVRIEMPEHSPMPGDAGSGVARVLSAVEGFARRPRPPMELAE